MTSDHRLYLVVQLWLKTGDVTAFEAFERNAANVMARHGGRIEQAIRLTETPSTDAPFEVHVVSFPDADAFNAYRIDPATQAVATLRAELIWRTIIWRGQSKTY